MIRAIAAIVLALFLAVALGACGKKGPPEPPPGATDEFPKKYPSE